MQKLILLYLVCLSDGLCPLRCECNDELLRVVCDAANFDVVPITLNPELRELSLSNNLIKAIRTSLSVYRHLQYLDASHNQLAHLTNDTFSGLVQLKVLLMSNNMIRSIDYNTFQDFTQLETLHLNANQLDQLPRRLFARLKSLVSLDLCQNRIQAIDDEAFYGLNDLRTLKLRDNKLYVIPSSAFQSIPKLQMLDLGLNSFLDIPEDSFSSLSELQELSLDGCNIRSIQNGALKWLNSLLILRIHDNDLEEVPTMALYDVSRLEELHIGQNKYNSIKSKAFQRLKSLRTVQINTCDNLIDIESGAFTDNTQLQNVVISHNKKLTGIRTGAFAPGVQYAIFRGNSFVSLQASLLQWEELQELDMRDNPINCNCSLLWLWQLLSTRNFTGAVCEKPDSLKGRHLSSLALQDLGCSSFDVRPIVGLFVSAVLLLIGAVALTHREKLAAALKSRWGRKEPQYHKTSAEEESQVFQAAHQSLKMTPVTEL